MVVLIFAVGETIRGMTEKIFAMIKNIAKDPKMGRNFVTFMFSGITEPMMPQIISIMISVISGSYFLMKYAAKNTITMMTHVEITVLVMGKPKISKITCGVTDSMMYPYAWSTNCLLRYGHPCHLNKNINRMIMKVMKTLKIAIRELEMAKEKTVKMIIHLKMAPPMINPVLIVIFWGVINFTDHCWLYSMKEANKMPITTQKRKLSVIM
jgi:hypothetical protein